MKLAHLLALSVVLAPLAVAAQSGAGAPADKASVAGQQSSPQGTLTAHVTQTGPDGKTTTFTITLPNPCPVGLSAQHLSDGDMVRTGSNHLRGLGQRLHVSLISPDTRTIARATFNVRGWTAQGRMEQASASLDGSQAVRTIQAQVTAGPDRTASADLWAPGLTSVSSVELLSVAFADGSTWTPAPGKSCRVMPDPLMAIAR